MEMIYVFTNRVRLCIFHLLFLLAGVSVTPFASAQIDPGDTYCANYMYSLSDNDFSVDFNISLNSYNSGWEPPAYSYMHVGNYNCEMIHRPQVKVCAIYQDGGNVECAVGYALTGRKYRGSNPGSVYFDDSSLNPSNPYLYIDGFLDRGTHCSEGEHIYAPFPKGYRYVPFDGFKLYSTANWSQCIYPQIANYLMYDDGDDYIAYGRNVVIKQYTWNKSLFSYGNIDCSSIAHDCLQVIVEIQPYYSDDLEYKNNFDFRYSPPFYVRCPPYAKFSPVHGACYILEADELLAGTGINDADLFAQPGGGDKFHVNFNSVNLLNQISKPGIHQCPSPLKTTFRGQVITFFDYSDACQMLGDYVKPFVLLLGSFISIAILLGISTASISANEG